MAAYVPPPLEVCCVQRITKIHRQQHRTVEIFLLTDVPLAAAAMILSSRKPHTRDLKWQEIVHLAFRRHLIETEDHPVIKRLMGAE